MAECNFEKDLEKLEKIVEALEEGGLSLDDSLKQFELGIKLARRCEKTLSEAEKKIEVLTKKANGELAAEPFDEATAAEIPSRAPKRKAPVEEAGVSEQLPVGGPDDEDDEEEEGELLF